MPTNKTTVNKKIPVNVKMMTSDFVKRECARKRIEQMDTDSLDSIKSNLRNQSLFDY